MAIQVSKLGVEKYTIQINEGGEIVLNPGLLGSVTINGNVDIAGALTAGSSTTVDTEDLVVFDNTIRLNAGETGPGVSLTTAGLVIDRGTRDDAFLFFDESKNSIRAEASIPGAFVFQDATALGGNLALFSLYASGIFTGGEDLRLVGSGSGIVKVTGTDNYESQIWSYASDVGTDEAIIQENPSQIPDRLSRAANFDDDTLVNVRGLIDYVTSYHLYNFQDRIVAATGDSTPTFVVAQDIAAGDPENKVSVVVSNTTISEFFENRVEIQNLRLIGASGSGNSTITSNSVNGSVILQGTGTGQIQINDFMNLTVQNDVGLPAPTDGVLLYSKTLGDGGTGLFFKNQDSTTDEIISRNKALLYSIIF
jgi:hypothetical protein